MELKRIKKKENYEWEGIISISEKKALALFLCCISRFSGSGAANMSKRSGSEIGITHFRLRKESEPMRKVHQWSLEKIQELQQRKQLIKFLFSELILHWEMIKLVTYQVLICIILDGNRIDPLK